MRRIQDLYTARKQQNMRTNANHEQHINDTGNKRSDNHDMYGTSINHSLPSDKKIYKTYRYKPHHAQREQDIR